MYETAKIIHLIALISWFAGLFYLPRLYVYHADANSKAIPMLQTMERRLYRAIMTPAMVVTIASGLWLIHLNPAMFTDFKWLHTKLTLVLILIAYHFSLGMFRKRFANGKCALSGKFFRFYNEVPTIILIAVVTLAVLKPY